MNADSAPKVRSVIWKYDLAYDAILEMPAGGKVLSVAFQKPHVRLWMLVDPEVPKLKRRVRLLSTGHELCGDSWEYAGMAIAPLGVVFHVFIEVV